MEILTYYPSTERTPLAPSSTQIYELEFLIHKALNSLAPQHISDLLTVYNPMSHLRSSGADLNCSQSDLRAEGTFRYCGPGLEVSCPLT